jgi:hypothetical protein
VDTTYDEARRCPKCQEKGELARDEPFRSFDGGNRNVTKGARLHTIVCKNDRCRWCDQVCRVIQVNPDGTIPPPITKRERQFPDIPDFGARISDQLKRQLEVELGGGGEVSR